MYMEFVTKYARTVAAAFLFLWVTIVFAGAEIKLHNAPPSQGGCFIQHIAEHLNLDVKPDCEADHSLIALIAADELLGELLKTPGIDDTATLSQITAAATAAANTLTDPNKKELNEAIAFVNANKVLFKVALELERNNYDPEKALTLGEDRFIGPWRTGKTAFAGKTYKCSETLFANDVGDYFNFLMGNVCTGAIEMRCIFARITHVLMSGSAFFILAAVFVYDYKTKLPWISTAIAILCFLIILVLPMITAVQTTLSVTKSFAAPGTNKYMGSEYEFGVLAPLITMDFQTNAAGGGATFAGSLLRLGTIPHDTQGECGLGWSESVVALVENLVSPVTVRLADQDELGNVGIALLAILDMLKYTVEFTPIFILRLVTIPVAIILLFCTLGANKTWAYKHVWGTDSGFSFKIGEP